jgi:ATP/maltotriose-dependent transcriptional regulator MalT
LQHPMRIHELVEAAVRTGREQLAAETLAELCAMTSVIGTDWALGIEARSRALLSDGLNAEDLYRDAIQRLERTGARVELARARLLYGEWLRRSDRRLDARAQLHAAYDDFAAFGLEAFAERARSELAATGQRVRKQAPETHNRLTAQERLIAELARDGLSNPEIAARLYLSRRTVEWHLRKVYSKLGIRSRRELADSLPRPDLRLIASLA